VDLIVHIRRTREGRSVQEILGLQTEARGGYKSAGLA